MKRTEYFLSSLHQYNAASEALTKCIEKRNSFIETQKIIEVENEKVEIFSVYSGNNIYVLLTLTFYTKS